MKSWESVAMSIRSFCAIALLTLFTSSLLAGEAESPRPSASAKGSMGKRSGTVVEIDRNNQSIKIRPRVIAMTTNAIDKASLPIYTMKYNDSTEFRRIAHDGATIDDLQTNDYVHATYDLNDEKKIAVQIFWGMPGRGTLEKTANRRKVPDTFDCLAVAGQIITSNNWSKSDPAAGKIINETDEHWDIAFPIPDAVQGGKKPDHRVIRVFKATHRTQELGID